MLSLHDVKRDSGFSLIEMVVTLAIIAILISIGTFNFKNLSKSIVFSSEKVESFLKMARLRAIASTSSMVVYPDSDSSLTLKKGPRCSEANNAVSRGNLTLPKGHLFADTSWKICFTSRGFSNTAVTFSISDSESNTKTIEVVKGGAVRTTGGGS